MLNLSDNESQLRGNMTKIIAVTQQKGGAGKTTITANLCTCISSLGYKVLLIDTDPQGSLSMWYNIRENTYGDNTIDFTSCLPDTDLIAEIKKKKTKYDFIFIDTPPHASYAAKNVINSSHYVVIPTQLSPPDIWASQPILDIAEAGGIHHILVLNRVPAQGKISSELHSSLLQNDIPIANTTIGNRNSFATSFLYGQGVVELDPRSRASEEIVSLAHEILTHLIKGKNYKAALA